jgi:hypothetical protein
MALTTLELRGYNLYDYFIELRQGNKLNFLIFLSTFFLPAKDDVCSKHGDPNVFQTGGLLKTCTVRRSLLMWLNSYYYYYTIRTDCN